MGNGECISHQCWGSLSPQTPNFIMSLRSISFLKRITRQVMHKDAEKWQLIQTAVRPTIKRAKQYPLKAPIGWLVTSIQQHAHPQRSNGRFLSLWVKLFRHVRVVKLMHIGLWKNLVS